MASSMSRSGYREINVKLDEKRGISMKQRLDRIMAIGIPIFVAVLFATGMAAAAYAVKTNVYQRWHTVVKTSTNIHYVSQGQYVHGTATDIAFDVLFGILALAVAIGCAYWAESWYRMVKRGY